MNISLPDGLKTYVDERVASKAYGTSSEYVRELIRRDQDRRQLKEHLLAGLRSGAAGPMDSAYFAKIRSDIRSDIRAVVRTDVQGGGEKNPKKLARRRA